MTMIQNDLLKRVDGITHSIKNDPQLASLYRLAIKELSSADTKGVPVVLREILQGIAGASDVEECPLDWFLTREHTGRDAGPFFCPTEFTCPPASRPEQFPVMHPDGELPLQANEFAITASWGNRGEPAGCAAESVFLFRITDGKVELASALGLDYCALRTLAVPPPEFYTSLFRMPSTSGTTQAK